uniref:hypothetical protein n=1 Tax=uncultured Erythrobacter sp. TaxID=263913 RepID=UPI0026200667|nr:hypothetical protein [uncultured Erythrobacter sp.]
MLGANSHGRQHSCWRLGMGVALCAAGIALSACGNSGGTAPGAVSEGEARALEEAAEMLEERRLPDGVVPDPDSPVAVAPDDDETAE